MDVGIWIKYVYIVNAILRFVTCQCFIVYHVVSTEFECMQSCIANDIIDFRAPIYAGATVIQFGGTRLRLPRLGNWQFAMLYEIERCGTHETNVFVCSVHRRSNRYNGKILNCLEIKLQLRKWTRKIWQRSNADNDSYVIWFNNFFKK